jgi:DNA-binding NarL/FixJ family response regulator
MQPIRLLLVDDQSLFREGLRTLLSVQPDFEVLGEAANGEEAVRLAARLHPDIILMDVRMPVLDGVAATRRICSAQPECRIIVLTTFDDDEYVFDGLRAGAVGYLLKDVPSEKLFEAVRAAARGESFLEPSVAAKVVAEFARLGSVRSSALDQKEGNILAGALSERELEILRLIADGLDNREIAERLTLSLGTVKSHTHNIYSKLNAESRTQAIARARAMGVL